MIEVTLYVTPEFTTLEGIFSTPDEAPICATFTFRPFVTVYLRLPMSKVCAFDKKIKNKKRTENCNFCFMIRFKFKGYY